MLSTYQIILLLHVKFEVEKHSITLAFQSDIKKGEGHARKALHSFNESFYGEFSQCCFALLACCLLEGECRIRIETETTYSLILSVLYPPGTDRSLTVDPKTEPEPPNFTD